MPRDATSWLLIIVVQIGQFLSKLNERIDETVRALQSCRRVELMRRGHEPPPVTLDMTATVPRGIVSKRADRPYRAGRSEDWVKVKNRELPDYPTIPRELRVGRVVLFPSATSPAPARDAVGRET